jgi:hypothetical protein
MADCGERVEMVALSVCDERLEHLQKYGKGS